MTGTDTDIGDFVGGDEVKADLVEQGSPLATDRTLPGWVTVVGAAFSVMIYACAVSLAVLTAFFHAQVANEGEVILAPLLAIVAVVPVLGILVFEFAYARALAGLRYMRGPAAIRVYALCGCITFAILAFLHPFVPIAGLFATGLGGFCLVFVGKLRRRERFWDFLVSEATPVLTGRDQVGFSLATVDATEHTLAPALVATFGVFALVGSFGLASYLVATEVIAPSAMTALALLNTIACVAILAFVRSHLKTPEHALQRDAQVSSESIIEEDAGRDNVIVRKLRVASPDGAPIIDDLSLSVPPGTMLAVTGDSGAGKSLVLSAISDPFALNKLTVAGTVRINGIDPWRRERSAFSVPAVLLPEQPIILPASGAENLACFQDGAVLHHAKRQLEHLTFSSELAEEICATTNATLLPSVQKKLLAFARAFNVAPHLYLFDRPEDGLSEKQIGMLLSRFKNETRLGRTIFLVTENRSLIEACDTIMVLQNGRMVDFGNAKDIRERQASGWARFVGQRSLEIEENLENWIRSHFKRPGDEANRRKAALLASEMLALSCQHTGAESVHQKFVLEFKHFVGHCLLRMQDNGSPITTATLQKAQQEVSQPRACGRLSPLATILSVATDVETSAEIDQRSLTVKLETYDPRATQIARSDAQTPA